MKTTMGKFRKGIFRIFLLLTVNAGAVSAKAETDTLAIDSCREERRSKTDTLAKKAETKPNLYRPALLKDAEPSRLETHVAAHGSALRRRRGHPRRAAAAPRERHGMEQRTDNVDTLLERWSYHVRKGPVWDGDNFIFNYILHPYAGAVYYMGARSIGFNQLGSFLYCTAISTIFWEYGIEAFMEKPSIQDLILTPLSGLLLGEVFYKLKRKIVSDGYRLWGSCVWGNIVAFIIDPVNEVIGLFAGNPCRRMQGKGTMPDISFMPWITPAGGGSAGFTLSIIR